jgi:hypothetical protein
MACEQSLHESKGQEKVKDGKRCEKNSLTQDGHETGLVVTEMQSLDKSFESTFKCRELARRELL